LRTFDEPGVAQDAEMLRDGTEGDVRNGARDVAGGGFVLPHQARISWRRRSAMIWRRSVTPIFSLR